jgi:threonine synthase
MKFYSTHKEAPDVDFKTTLFNGLAPDGGLYMPRQIPKFTAAEIAKLSKLQDIGFAVLRKWITEKEIPDKDLRKIVSEAFSFPIPLVTVGKYTVLELFHGPTMAFKDIAAGVLSRLLAYYLEQEDKTSTILVATSGDTGGAIAQAFSGNERVKVVILYPTGKVSELQEEQLTRVDENVTTLAIDATFDECQAFVKKAFQDEELQQLNLSSANSINIGRLIPQIIYYFWASVQSEKTNLRFVVPSGNMGNATAALFAHKMGMPLDSLVIATNENDAVVKYYETGVYKPKKSVQTLSTAMDIGKPSNFERILELFDHDYEEFRKIITAVKVTDAETVYEIGKAYAYDKYLMDFHTAVGYSAAEKIPAPDSHTILVSTASAQKFAKEMEKETGIVVDNSDILKNLRTKKKRVTQAENNYEAVKRVLLKQKPI